MVVLKEQKCHWILRRGKCPEWSLGAVGVMCRSVSYQDCVCSEALWLEGESMVSRREHWPEVVPINIFAGGMRVGKLLDCCLPRLSSKSLLFHIFFH